MTVELVAGAVVADHYRLDRLLGEGGMGIVWAATDLKGGADVALKLLRPGVAESMSGRRRFLREARALAAVKHPSVVTIHDVLALEDGTPVLVMDLLEGEPLRDRLDREMSIALPAVARILLPVVSVVGAAHALGIVHRDLKPDNIFLVRAQRGPSSDAGPPVKVLDFGIAKLTAAEGDAAATGALTRTGAMLGTPYYMAPEQILAEPDIDHRADIWSIGVILYECLTSVRPTEAESVGKVLKRILAGNIVPVQRVLPDLPEDIAAMIDRMLSFDRNKRPNNLDELESILERYAAISFRAPGRPDSIVPAAAGRSAAAATHEAPLLATLPATPSPTPVPTVHEAVGAPPVVEPPAVEPPAVEPSAVEPPAVEPPAVEPPGAGPAPHDAAAQPLVGPAAPASDRRRAAGLARRAIVAGVLLCVVAAAIVLLVRACARADAPDDHPAGAAILSSASPICVAPARALRARWRCGGRHGHGSHCSNSYDQRDR